MFDAEKELEKARKQLARAEAEAQAKAAIAAALPPELPQPRYFHYRDGSLCPYHGNASLAFEESPSLGALMAIALPVDIVLTALSSYRSFMPRCLSHLYKHEVGRWEPAGRYLIKVDCIAKTYRAKLCWWALFGEYVVEIEVEVPCVVPPIIQYSFGVSGRKNRCDRILFSPEINSGCNRVPFWSSNGASSFAVYHPDGLPPQEMYPPITGALKP